MNQQAGETCRCGTECVLVTHEGAQHALCPNCDAIMINAINTGNIPTMQVWDESDGPPSEAFREAEAGLLPGELHRRKQDALAIDYDSDGFEEHGSVDDDDDDFDDDDDPSDPFGELAELAQEREEGAWEIFVAMASAARDPLWPQLAERAFDAYDAFNAEAQRREEERKARSADR